MIGYLFEQSGTFKNAFKKYGYNAEDIDIQNTFNETDLQCDLFYMIESKSIIDLLKQYDFCMCFFPCTWFSDFNNMIISGTQYQMQTMDETKKQRIIAERKVNTLLTNKSGQCDIIISEGTQRANPRRKDGIK